MSAGSFCRSASSVTMTRPRAAPKPAAKERHDVDLGVLVLQRLEDVERAVRRAIVHGHDLVAPAPGPAGQRLVDLPDQDRQILALIVHRDDQRELKRGGHT
jgi:hypothetical protein